MPTDPFSNALIGNVLNSEATPGYFENVQNYEMIV